MKGKRTGVDFDNYGYQRSVFVCGGSHIIVDELFGLQPLLGPIRFINGFGKLVVIGDYGDWTFKRGCIPSNDQTPLSDSYWHEKLDAVDVCARRHPKKVPEQLLVVFDAFEEICRRIAEHRAGEGEA